MSNLVLVNEQNFEAEVLRSQVPVLVEFGASWCQPCKMLEPELEALALELGERARIVKVDIDQSPALAQALRIQSVPTLIVINGGRPVDAAQGVLKRQALKELLLPHLPRAAGAVSVTEALKLSQAGACQFVDTREEAVFLRSRLQGAIHLPLDEVETRLAELMQLPTLPILYCRTGKDTEALANRLSEAGTPLAFLEGGVLGWEAEGGRLLRPD